VRIWDRAHQRYHRVVTTIDDWPVFGFAFSPDSQCIAVLANQPKVAVVEIDTADVRGSSPTKSGAYAISWSPDGKYIATTGYETQLWAPVASA
jgi:WD40 repeat protein